jgi:hypothetical protein
MYRRHNITEILLKVALNTITLTSDVQKHLNNATSSLPLNEKVNSKKEKNIFNGLIIFYYLFLATFLFTW